MNLQKHPVWKEVERSDETVGQAYDFWLCLIKSRLKRYRQIINKSAVRKHLKTLRRAQHGAEKVPKAQETLSLKGTEVSQGTSPQTLLGTGSTNDEKRY